MNLVRYIRAIAYARKGMRNPAKRVFGVFWWGYAPTKTPHFLSSVVGNRPNAIALEMHSMNMFIHGKLLMMTG